MPKFALSYVLTTTVSGVESSIGSHVGTSALNKCSCPNGNIQDGQPGVLHQTQPSSSSPYQAQPKHGNQPTPRPALPEQTRPDTDCHPVTVHSPPPHFPPPIPWLASDGRHARYRQPHSAQRTNRRRPHCKTTHSTAKALRMAKPLFPAHRLATRTAPEKWRLFVTPYLYSQTPSIHHPVVMCILCHQTANSHSQRAGTCNCKGSRGLPPGPQ